MVVTLADKLAEVEAETLGDTVSGMEERGCPFPQFLRQVSGETWLLDVETVSVP